MEACAIANVMNFQPLSLILSTSLISISYSFVSFYRGFAFLTGVYVKYLSQNRFAFFISLFNLSAILKIRNGEHAHYVGLMVAYTWNREKQMFVALGKEFDMVRIKLLLWPYIALGYVDNYLKNSYYSCIQKHRHIGNNCFCFILL